MTSTVLARLAPDATDMIRADHARVVTTFHRYRSDASPAVKRSLVATICLALEVHAEMEEEIFYPAMASVDNALIGRFLPEHDRMRSLIGELRAADPAEPHYDSRVMELMREVMHHVADEETALLPQAERVLGERLGELGARMMKRRLALMAPHAGELTRHHARAMPLTTLVLPALALAAGIALLRHVRRYA
jgi:hemerythrin superfamily protein